MKFNITSKIKAKLLKINKKETYLVLIDDFTNEEMHEIIKLFKSIKIKAIFLNNNVFKEKDIICIKDNIEIAEKIYMALGQLIEKSKK